MICDLTFLLSFFLRKRSYFSACSYRMGPFTLKKKKKKIGSFDKGQKMKKGPNLLDWRFGAP